MLQEPQDITGNFLGLIPPVSHMYDTVLQDVNLYILYLYSLQEREPGNYRLIFRNPENCISSECDIFVGIDTNSGDDSFLDIYMEGSARDWVAVGFSDSQNMVGSINF